MLTDPSGPNPMGFLMALGAAVGAINVAIGVYKLIKPKTKGQAAHTVCAIVNGLTWLEAVLVLLFLRSPANIAAAGCIAFMTSLCTFTVNPQQPPTRSSISALALSMFGAGMFLCIATIELTGVTVEAMEEIVSGMKQIAEKAK